MVHAALHVGRPARAPCVLERRLRRNAGNISYRILVMAYQLWRMSYGILVLERHLRRCELVLQRRRRVGVRRRIGRDVLVHYDDGAVGVLAEPATGPAVTM